MDWLNLFGRGEVIHKLSDLRTLVPKYLSKTNEQRNISATQSLPKFEDSIKRLINQIIS